MPISPYVQWLRGQVGQAPLLLPSASVLIFDDRQRLLIVRPHGTDTWVSPGGAVDPGESPVDAAIREAHEETGLHVEITGIFGVFGGPEFRVTYPNGDIADYIMTSYIARVISGELEALDGEIAEMRWVTREELAQVNLSRWARIVLPHAFEEDPNRWWMRPTSK